MIPRPLYMQQLHQLAEPSVVKVLAGVRRCGKSTLLQQLANDLIEDGLCPDQVVRVDFELPSNAPLADPQVFHDHVAAAVTEFQATHLFVDEVQELREWEKTINGLRAEFGLNIYVTGSNARLFAGENMTYLSGRYVLVPVYPLSLMEFCQFTDVDVVDRAQVRAAYDLLTRQGGFPAVALASNDLLKNALMEGLYDSVLTRDVVLRGRIRNEAAFARVLSFIMENVGNQTSASAIARALKAGGHSVNAETVDNYLSLLEKAHVLYRCERYDIRGKERLRTNGKYYVVDAGLRNRVIGERSSNRGHVTENMVFLELLRRGCEVAVGTLPSAEIDFVVQKDGCRAYVQVSETVMDPSTLERELAPFAKIPDSYPRVLITKDDEDYGEDGVIHLNLHDFLLGEALPGLDG